MNDKHAAAVLSSRSDISLTAYAAYGLLGFPLAMSALPVYVQIPAYYVSHLGLPLSTVGWILFLARLIDTVQDPFLGRWIDHQTNGIRGPLVFAASVLALSFFGLWAPLADKNYRGYWLALMLICAYSAHSLLNIAYLSWGARLQISEQTPSGIWLNAAAWREGSGLLGVIIASVVPSMIIAGQHDQILFSMAGYSSGFAFILTMAIIALFTLAPAWQRTCGTKEKLSNSWQKLKDNVQFQRLLAPYFLNAISISIPATLVIFFINDRLQEPTMAGAFLGAYFVSASIGLPIWVILAKRIGVLKSWRIGMFLSIAAFSSAFMLNAGDGEKYFAVCIAAGFSLGADLSLPPVLLAQTLKKDEAIASYYGIWTLLGKLALAISGLMLPLLTYVGYHSGSPNTEPLIWVYAATPCAFKLIALLSLMRVNQREVTP